ncbi:MAG TPA: glycosyltransferase family 4 protein [Anaeromyxobacteraceae bacterium]|nr:glycosyltransferase family 4 protein [Anaeromyxobacteraceae bacterium]
MRIALVSTPFLAVPPRGYGGTELIVHELQQGLARAGHDVTLFATGDSDGPDVRWVFERPIWPPRPDVEVEHARFAAREIAREGYDLVHAHVGSMVPEAAWLGAPMVYTLHHAHVARLTRLYEAHAGEVRYVAISARQAEIESSLHCDVVHHGLDPERHPQGRGDGGYALFIGRFAWCKAPDIAAEAAQMAGVDLAMAGALHDEPTDPPGWNERMTRILEMPGIRRVGQIQGERKFALLGGASALLMPLRWEEPFGLVMIEAMLCGTPVVAFRLGSTPEIVEDGVTGYVVDDVAEMADALRAAGALDRSACRRRARERFSASRMVRDYLRVYHAALSAGEPPWQPEPEDSRYAAH